MTQRPDPLPRWDPIRTRWQLGGRKNGVRRTFYSSRLGHPGELETIRKYRAWKRDQTDKANWRFDRAWTAYLAASAALVGKFTYDQREAYGRLYISPAIGQKKMGAISNQDWQDLIILVSKKPVRAGRGSGSTISKKVLKNLRGVIMNFLRYAKDARMVSELPERLSIPKSAPVGKRIILQPDAFRLLFAEWLGWYTNAWRLMAITGLRPGEVYGLQPNDLAGNILTISRAMATDRELTDGKNVNARRTIVLPELAVKIIQMQRDMTRLSGIKSDYIFTDTTGRPVDQKGAYHQWRKQTDKRGIECSPYELRHTFISHLRATLPDAHMKDYVGHSTSMDTDGTYGHEVDGEMLATAAEIDAYLNKILAE